MKFVVTLLTTLQLVLANGIPSGPRVALLIGNAKYDGLMPPQFGQ